MLGTVTETADHLAGIVSRLEAGTLTGEQASVLLQEFARIERLAAAGVGLLAKRVEETHQWRRSGHRNAAEHLAAQTGLGVGEAHGRLDTAHRLGDLPATAAAYRNGELSQIQAREVTAAGITDPTSEQHLLDTARTRDLKRLKEQAERVKAAADRHEMTSYNAVRATRYLRRVTHPDGVKGLSIRATNDDLATILTAIKSRTETRFHQARRQGQHEHPDAYALDALVGLCHDQLGTHQTTTTRHQPKQPGTNQPAPPPNPTPRPDPARRPTRNGDGDGNKPPTTQAPARPPAAAGTETNTAEATAAASNVSDPDSAACDNAASGVSCGDLQTFLDNDGAVVLSAADRVLHHRAQQAADTDRAAGKTPPHQNLRATIERAEQAARANQAAAPAEQPAEQPAEHRTTTNTTGDSNTESTADDRRKSEQVKAKAFRLARKAATKNTTAPPPPDNDHPTDNDIESDARPDTDGPYNSDHPPDTADHPPDTADHPPDTAERYADDSFEPEEPEDHTIDDDYRHDDGSNTVVSRVTRGAGPKTTIQYRVDHAAYERGYTIPGEISEIIGYGPIPVNVIRAASGDSIITALLTNGTDVQRVTHLGRTIPADVHRAIEERDENRCVVCSSANRVEIDHYQIDYHRHGPTEMWNLCTLCHHHHNLKTHHGFSVTGGPGNWHYHTPDHTPTPTCCPVTPTTTDASAPIPDPAVPNTDTDTDTTNATPNAPPDHEESHERECRHDHNRVGARTDSGHCADPYAQQPPLW